MNPAQAVGERYKAILCSLIESICETESHNVEKAAHLIAEQVKSDRLIYVYGVGGHSFVGSEEFFYRAGGLACISPLYELSLGLFAGGRKSTMLERVEHIGDKIVAAHDLQDDLLIITSLYGMNACTIDAALEAKRRNCTVIGITSLNFVAETPKDFPARHSTGKDLADVADVIINQHVPPGEAALDINGLEQRVGGTGTILQCFAINWLVCRAVEKLIQQGCEPPIWRSANVPGGDEKNSKYVDKYAPRVKFL